ncbi:DUF4983 domain-containing protein [Pedobacter insulae]|uniref:Concanavalin A-like lectin/glucanases superfamily protein n=1 Tax=Pedobacter insulae TaxID=414048 RepID=A0A1I2WI50_9SPHI|nr:DUF4983 domain-containing protein [Pedobacter insulae]SFH00379.1 Concanavalin A-like lectin/glucanases superfamily protein [Pedobacter insulae]
MKDLTKYKQSFLINTVGLVCLAAILLFASSCNKDFPNTLRVDYPDDTTNVTLKERKVLYIILDGVRGNALKTVNPPNLAQIVRKSIYAYDALSDFGTNAMTNAGAWTNATTGVTSDKHKVVSEDFSGSQLATYPSLFTRLKQVKPNLRTASIAASQAFNANLALDAVSKVNFENDDAKVKDAIVEELKKPEAAVVIGQFHSAEIAGAANGYTDNTTAYTNAILTLDTYIGNIMTALQQRPTFAKEDWMVVIASNKGGNVPVDPGSVGLGAFSDPVRNNFIAFYNPRFVSQITPKPDINSLPYSGFAPRFTGTSSIFTNAKLNNNTLGNFGSNGQFTFVCKIKNDGAASNYPAVVSKRASFNIGVPGWVLFLENDVIMLNIGQVGFSNRQVSFGKIRDGIWHSLAFKIYNDAGKRWATVFLDGVKGLSLDITDRGNFDTTAPFTLGGNFAANEGGTINVLIKDIALFSAAISDADLVANMKKAVISADYPNYASLAGYWPANEGGGTTIADVSGKAPSFTTSANINWTSFSDSSPHVSPLISSATFGVVINNVDIPYQIYQWMGIIVPNSWDLMGKTWRPTYTDVRNN